MALSHANAKGKGIDSEGSEKSKIMRSEEEIPRKPFGEFKTINSILLTKYCSHHTEISTKDIVTGEK